MFVFSGDPLGAFEHFSLNVHWAVCKPYKIYLKAIFFDIQNMIPKIVQKNFFHYTLQETQRKEWLNFLMLVRQMFGKLVCSNKENLHNMLVKRLKFG